MAEGAWYMVNDEYLLESLSHANIAKLICSDLIAVKYIVKLLYKYLHVVLSVCELHQLIYHMYTRVVLVYSYNWHADAIMKWY